MNVVTLLEMAASIGADNDAVVAPDGRVSFDGLLDLAGRAARVLRDSGAKHVAYTGANHLAFPITLFGTCWAGISFSPVNFRLGSSQMHSVLHERPDTVVVGRSDEIPPEASDLKVITTDDWPAALMAVEPLERWEDEPDDIALLLFTSGTTSAPKAAVLRHRHLTAYVLGSVEFAGAEPGDAALVSVPPYHIAGVANLLTNLYSGRRIVYLDAFSAEKWLDAAVAEGVTNAMVVPTMLARIVELLEQEPDRPLPALKTLSYGGSRMPPRVVGKALELFPDTDFVNAYGLTETTSSVAVLGPEEHRAAVASDDPAVQARLGSAGLPLPGIELQVRGPMGEVLPAGEPGELFIRGEQVSGEYLQHSSQVDPEGWFATRDRASIDADGYLYIEGRTDDTIIRGGENIAPAEIEDVLLRHPGVGDVVVVGVPDEEWGQRLAAVVVPSLGVDVDPEEVRAFAKANLRSSKTPDSVLVWDELPRTPTGKIVRRDVLAKIDSDK